ncbi:MAG: selenide, water dikinase [Erysipelotrichaceae bacterium]|nr:selenide, water dikinase [Erysipelotrichaceae bacterium]
MNKVLAFLSDIKVIIAIAILIIILTIWLIMRKSKVNNYKKQLKEYEVRYNSIKSVPLPFKLNKALAIARLDENTMKLVDQCKTDFEMTQANLKQISQCLADTEDDILLGRLKKAKEGLLDLDSFLALGEEQVSKLDKFLESILAKETAQRAEVTKLKEEFRNIKQEAAEKSSSLSYSWNTIEKNFASIEKMFSAFEEWMYASDYEKAGEELEEIKTSIANLNTLVNDMPDLLQEARGVIPNLMEEVNKQHSALSHRGVYLHHLEIDKNLSVITSNLQDDLDAIRSGDTSQVPEHLQDYKVRLQQLLDSLKKEEQSFDELKTVADETVVVMDELVSNIKYVDTQYRNVSVRFGLEELEDKIKDDQNRLMKLQTSKAIVYKKMSGTVPASAIMISLKDLYQEANALNKDVKDMKDKLDSAKSDEERAKKQLMKLQLIMNEMQVKIRKNKLPSISASYNDDVVKANEYINSIDTLISNTPLNVELLNSTLKDAIDFIYKLYNNVNNIVGMAIMVENTIVFGNKYRSSYPDIDSELTRAELSFRNGEYTQALTIAIQTIEKIHPGSYESLIKENAKSAA